ncbi:hypothetical protein E4U54_003862 [Claviceps lovelessii]|nr:hypothetical protein E4U54_003862 [Claviceps lovelessii]
MKDILVDERFRVEYKIGEGGFGLVYAGTDLKTEEEVAIKLSHVRDDGLEALEYEADTYKALAGGVGIPRVIWFGRECDYHVLVQELLGPSLEDVFNYCGRKFSLKTVLLIADQCINRIKYIHDKGYLHCDVKPDNFLLGIGRQGNVIYTIDFGLAREFDEESDGQGIRDHRPFGGTTRYASMNNHKQLPQSRADDLESLGYVLLYFARGFLPWQGLKASNRDKRVEAILKLKTETPVEELCKDLPEAFAEYMTYIRSLQPADKPDYARLLKVFKTLFTARGFQYDNVYDWTEKRFYELQEESNRAAEEQMGTEPTDEQMDTEPTEERANAEPTDEQMDTEPTEEQVNTEPTEEQMDTE